MNELRLKMILHKMKKDIYVNRDFKKDLRNEFASKASVRHNHPKRWMAIAAAVCIVLVFSISGLITGPSHVSAASLKIESYLSFVSLGGGRNVSVSEYNGTIYANFFGQGIFTYSDKGFFEIHEGEVNSVSVSGDGKKLVFSEGGSIKIYDLTTHNVSLVLQGSDTTNYYEASWLPDNHSILYTCETPKHIGGKEEQLFESIIYKMDLNDPKPERIAEGSYASYINGKDAVVFENRREGKVIYKSLKDGTEKIIGEGSEAYASPDGKYIVMTKSEISTREITKNVKVETGLQNIYIVDTDNPGIIKRVTSNVPLKDIDENEWLKGIEPSGEEQILSYSGMYCYSYPRWSSDSKSIFAMKQITSAEDPRKKEARLIKISFDKKELSGRKLVESYLMSLATDDKDYAGSLIDFADSNASEEYDMAGYNIIGSGRDEKTDYIDAAVSFISNGNKLYRVEKSRYYLGTKDDNPIIKSRKVLDTVEVSTDSDTISMGVGGKEKVGVLTLKDIQREYNDGDKGKFVFAAFSPVNNVIYFTLQNPDNRNSLKVLSYDITSKEMKLLDSIEGKDSEISMGRLIADYSGEYAALNHQVKEARKVRDIATVYSYKSQSRRILNTIEGQDAAESLSITFNENGSFDFKNLSFSQYIWFRYIPSNNEVQSIK